MRIKVSNLIVISKIMVASDNGWISENSGRCFDNNISQTKYGIVSKYSVWNPDPQEFAAFLHALSGLDIKCKINGNETLVKFISEYRMPEGFSLKLMKSNIEVNRVYIDNNTYKYITSKIIVFPELRLGTHIVKIYSKKYVYEEGNKNVYS